MDRATNLLKQVWNPIKSAVRNYPYSVPFTEYLQNLPETQYTKLANGLTVATEERECYNACIGLIIDGGSRYESNFENGIAHFFEHIAFKGTKARNKHELEAQMSCLGARFKCFTTREMAVYYVECLCQDTSLAADILIDCVFNNALSPRDIEHQKETVYCEMVKHDKIPQEVVHDYLHATAFQGTSLAHTVMGPSSNLDNFTDVTISRYLSKCFNPCRTVLASVGGVKHEQMVSLANSNLCNLQPLKSRDIDLHKYTGSDIRFRDNKVPVVHVLVAVEGPSLCADDNVVMEIAQHVISGWDQPQPRGQKHPLRVARTASKGTGDFYQAFNINYKDCGLWGVHFISKVMELDNMVLLLQDQFLYMCLSVTELEVEKAKNILKAKILSQMESASRTCLDIGRWTLYHGCRPSLLQKMKAIDRVTAQDVCAVCDRYLYDKTPVIVAVGPAEGLLDNSRHSDGMYWLRF